MKESMPLLAAFIGAVPGVALQVDLWTPELYYGHGKLVAIFQDFLRAFENATSWSIDVHYINASGRQSLFLHHFHKLVKASRGGKRHESINLVDALLAGLFLVSADHFVVVASSASVNVFIYVLFSNCRYMIAIIFACKIF